MPPPTPTPTEETQIQPDRPEITDVGQQAPAAEEPARDPDAPVSFVPHVAVRSTARLHPLRIQTGRYGEMEQHELVRLLDTLEDERARARFRESVYISLFIWMAVALTALFGPRYLWHAPRVVLPSDVLRQREMTRLTAPTLNAPRLRSSPPPAVDNRTLEHLRASAPKVPAAPRPEQPTPQPATRTPAVRPLPSAPTPNLQPSTAPPNLPPAPPPPPR